MPDYVLAAERAARKYGVDPAIFKAMIRQESGFNPNARSPAGAQGIAQFMPGTAPGYGVNLHDNRVTDDLEGAAKYIAANLKRTGGNYHEALSIYNSGRPDGYRSIPETKHYVATILANAGNHAPTGRGTTASARSTGGGSTGTTTTTTPGVDNSDARRQALSSFLLGGGTDPTTGQQTSGDILSLALQMRQLKDVPGQTTTTPARGAGATSVSGSVSSGGSGAHAALSWAESKLGQHESGGPNQGGLASYLNQRFGMSGQPWCAMFTSAAVTKGGAPLSARTASVAQVRQKAMQGVGYQRGYVPGRQARPGDLILFGNQHIGMVKSNSNGQITYVGGNQSDAVTEGRVAAGGASIVRPKYGARG